MAGIDRICEYSGNYPGWAMYSYKRNLIQVMPEYRKLFRGKKAELIFFIVKNPIETYHFRDRDGIHSVGCSKYDNTYKRINGKLFHQEKRKPLSEVKYYEYALVVPELPGRVNGIYMNWSYDKGSVLRRLSRLIGRDLVIKKSPLTYQQWRGWEK